MQCTHVHTHLAATTFLTGTCTNCIDCFNLHHLRVGGVLLSGSFYMCPTVECILCSETVYTVHCTKQ